MKKKLITLFLTFTVLVSAVINFNLFEDFSFPDFASAAGGILEVEYLGNPVSGPVFEVKNMLPGDCEERDVVIRNASSDSFGVSVKSENEINNDNLASQISFEILNPTSLFSNTLDNFYSQASINLGNFSPGQEVTYKFRACFSLDAGNEYQGTSTIFDLVFNSTIGHDTNLPQECSALKEEIKKFFVGTPGDDNLKGTSQNDFIDAKGGNDKIDSKSGHDCIVGGEGNDQIAAGSGADIVLAGEGNDDIDTGSGADIVYASSGNDYIDAGSADDKVWGGQGNDTVKAGSGDDEVLGEENNDELWGESGDDKLNGGPQTDILRGGSGTDTCIQGENVSTCEL